MDPIALLKNERPSFVIVEGLVALSLVVMAIMVEVGVLHHYQVKITEARMTLKKQLVEKERALEDWQRVVDERETKEHVEN